MALALPGLNPTGVTQMEKCMDSRNCKAHWEKTSTEQQIHVFMLCQISYKRETERQETQ